MSATQAQPSHDGIGDTESYSSIVADLVMTAETTDADRTEVVEEYIRDVADGDYEVLTSLILLSSRGPYRDFYQEYAESLDDAYEVLLGLAVSAVVGDVDRVRNAAE